METLKKLNVDSTSADRNQETSNQDTRRTIEVRNIMNITSKERNRRIIQNFRLIWLDSTINEDSNEESNYTITKLREVINTVHKFVDVDECVDFITDIEDEKIFMIYSADSAQAAIPLIHDMPQISRIYILCQNEIQYEQDINDWTKVKGIFTDITAIYQALKPATYKCDRNSVPISFIQSSAITSNQYLDTLDLSFMYTQILKEIFLTIEFKQSHTTEFLTYCREQFNGNMTEIKNIDKIEMEYHDYQPIWWYTYNSFLYSMLNRALRLMEVDQIIKMGFFIRDLHNHIVELHSEQFREQNHSDTFIVYRGQGLSHADFDQLKKTQGGLMSFNSFLSTSLDEAVSRAFAESSRDDPDLFGILFRITISPIISSIHFANIKNISYYQTEEEILFSMHSVFRIGEVTRLDGHNRLWQVDLTLTSDNDPQLHAVTKSIKQEIEGTTGWDSLGKLMIKLGEFNKAEELYNILLTQATDEGEISHISHQLGRIKNNQGKHAEAIELHQNSIKIREKVLSPTDPDLTTSYNNIGEVYNNTGEYSKALSYYEKALELAQKTLPRNYRDLATSYNNIGVVYSSMGEYSKALSYSENTHEIAQTYLPENHPDLAISYHNIGGVYRNMGEYSKALLHCDKALEIAQKSLPENHPLLSYAHNTIGELYKCMSEHSKALLHYAKALEIVRKTLSENHPNLANFYNNIGLVYDSMGEYSKALSFYEKALEIKEKILLEDHPDFVVSYNNIGLIYGKMAEYLKALSYYEKAFEIARKTLSENHPLLATCYNNIGSVYDNMGEYSKARSYCEKALEIREKILSKDHQDFVVSYNNIGMVYKNTGECSKALLYLEKALEIARKTLSENHPLLATCYNNIGFVYDNMGEYSNALSFYEKALEIRQTTLPENHPDLATSYNNISFVYCNMREYSKALTYYEKALEIYQDTLPMNRSNLATCYNSIGSVYNNMGQYSKSLSNHEKALEIIEHKNMPENHLILCVCYSFLGLGYFNMGKYSKALSYHQKALEIRHKNLPENHPELVVYYNNIGLAYNKMVTIGAPPVVENVHKDKKDTDDTKADSSDEVLNNLEYGRYLKEVVEILENDPEFKKKIENASLDDIKSGNIAQHLGLVQHHVRTKLDEAKQREMARLRELVGHKIRNLSEQDRMDLAQGNENRKRFKDIIPQHVDHKNGETFGQADLERLIQHASKDLDEIDRQREQEFKEYEMRKEYERRAKLTQVSEEERKKLEAIHQKAVEDKKHHPKVNHPGSVDQMEEVWENVDHLEADQFNPKSFFKLHDVNSDGYLDEGEIEAIMLKEAEKIHDGTPEADPIEKQEEMDRMREHVMKEFDKNSDRMLSYQEFELGINGTGAKNDQGWQSIEDSTIYSDQDFQKFSDELAHAPTPNVPPQNIPVSNNQDHIPPAPNSH